jgi:hypothetical protein
MCYRIRVLVLLFMLPFLSCNNEGKSRKRIKERAVVTDTAKGSVAGWQDNFGLTHDPDEDTIGGKAVAYYLDQPGCDPLAKDFYYGSFRPSDNYGTDHLLNLACSGNATLRPFYRWILDMTIRIQDGALAEHTGGPARCYAEKYPQEFFAFLDEDSTSYGDWVAAINYSGAGSTEQDDPAEIAENMMAEMKKHCNSCPEPLLARIRKFAGDCF